VAGVTDEIVTIIGPTAVGKSALALEVAELMGGEIVNADSMQGYLGMDIGTAKPSAAERQRVPHHVIDVWDPIREISVVEFRDRARSAIEEIQARGRVPIVVGGSWLYVQAIVDEMDFPPTDPLVRRRWEEELRRRGSIALHDELRRRDPLAAAEITPTNARRIVRALEVVELTGSFTARLPEARSWRTTRWIGLDIDRGELDERIRDRVARMWRSGFVEEVAGLTLGRTAGKALGYQQIRNLLAGEVDEPTAIEDTIVTTRRFARRQQRRFRADARVTWLPAGVDAADVVARLG
jgi:tRNA dimethylallyltransferase